MNGNLDAWRPGAGAWNRAAVAHLHRRAGFGATEAEIERDLARDPHDAIDELLERDAHAPEMLGTARHLLASGDIEQLAAWWFALILSNGAPLRERVTLMWHDHFATSDAKVDDVRMMHAQNELLREQGLGDFRDLLRSIARDPAMLVFLDGNENRRGAPNENFARELFELFALGRGAYSEDDIQEAARAFTGWGTSGRSYRYRAEWHDADAKRVFGRSLSSGDEVIDAVLAHEECPRFVARRLLSQFVGPEPRPAWVDACAKVLVERDWNIASTLAVIAHSELFFSPAARRSRIAGPVELIAMTARTLGHAPAPLEAAALAEAMGQALFRPPSVKGWDGGTTWINASAWVARHNHLLGAIEASALDLDEGDVVAAAIERLTPDLAGGEFAAALRQALAGEDDPRAALALLITAPEYQLL